METRDQLMTPQVKPFKLTDALWLQLLPLVSSTLPQKFTS